MWHIKAKSCVFQKVEKDSKRNIDIGFHGVLHVLTQVFYDKGEIWSSVYVGNLALPKDVDPK